MELIRNCCHHVDRCRNSSIFLHLNYGRDLRNGKADVIGREYLLGNWFIQGLR